MRHGSLFSGIGGFDLAAEWMGWENKFHCEMNEFGQRILHHYWPKAELFSDITKSDFTKYYGTIDLISGGFPCQPYSNAGERKGKEDERHLWPEMLRAIREIAPSWVVGENVRGLTNWNGGLVFDEVCADLENLGYKVTPCLIPACSTNAPHKRERIWFIAYAQGRGRGKQPSENSGWENRRSNHDGEICNASNTSELRLEFGKTSGFMGEGQEEVCGEGNQLTNAFETDGNPTLTSNTDSTPSQCRNSETSKEWEEQSRRAESFSQHRSWEVFPTQSPICGGDDGLPTELDGITFPKWRTESIKAYGNAVVPQVVFEIFKAIEKYESLHNA
jgi:DNA (cytosine-5)-methyltransferase 1